MKINYLTEWEDFDDANLNTVGTYLDNQLNPDNIGQIVSNEVKEVLYNKFNDDFKHILLSIIEDTLKSGGSSRPSTKEGILLQLYTDRHPNLDSHALDFNVDYDNLYECIKKNGSTLSLHLPAKLGVTEIYVGDYEEITNKFLYSLTICDVSMAKVRSTLNKCKKKLIEYFKTNYKKDIDVDIVLDFINEDSISDKTIYRIENHFTEGYDLLISLLKNGSFDKIKNKIQYGCISNIDPYALNMRSSHKENTLNKIKDFYNLAGIKSIYTRTSFSINNFDFRQDKNEITYTPFFNDSNYIKDCVINPLNNLLSTIKNLTIKLSISADFCNILIQMLYAYDMYAPNELGSDWMWKYDHDTGLFKMCKLKYSKAEIKKLLSNTDIKIIEPIIKLINIDYKSKQNDIYALDLAFKDSFKNLIKIFSKHDEMSIQKLKDLINDLRDKGIVPKRASHYGNGNYDIFLIIKDGKLTKIDIK